MLAPNKLRFPFTFAALALCIAGLYAALIGHINIIELPFEFRGSIAPDELDDIVVLFLLVIVGFAVDQIVAAGKTMRAMKREEARIATERAKVVQVTMQNVQEIVSSCLDQLKLLRREAEGQVSREWLMVFEQSVGRMSTKLNALGELQKHVEEQMGGGAEPR